MSAADFVADLEAGLGRAIPERYDPQFRPSSKPNFYIYMVNKDHYFFAVHLHQSYPFAKRIAANYNKAEISSAADAQDEASLAQQLLASHEFTSALQVPIVKRGFFEAREKQYEAFTKRK